MPLSNSLNVALKEWAIVCRALEQGRQILLLRKGGIYESGGEFELEHRQFLLFPTYLHQNLKMLKPGDQEGFEARSEEPKQVRLSTAGVVTDILEVQSRQQMDALDGEHVWTPPLIDMRFSYRPENPLYLLLLRVYRLAEVVMIENTLAYAGCKSWVKLDAPVPLGQTTPALDDETYERCRARIRGVLG